MSRNIDDDALGALLTQVGGDTGSQSRFVRDFVDLWDSRVSRLKEALERTDYEAVHVVLLSIRSSSRMVGAVVIEATATLMHSALNRQDIQGVLRHIDRIVQVGAETCAEFSERFELAYPSSDAASR